MIVETFPVGPLSCNCSIVGDEVSHEAIVIDPGADINEILTRLENHHLTVKQIIVTHGHIDHVGGAQKLKALTGAPVLMNQRDLEQLERIGTQASWFGVATPQVAPPDESAEDGMVIGLTSLPMTVLHTPGHTQGSICLHMPEHELLFTGDTLFAGTVGRTDLPGGNTGQLLDSIRQRLLPMKDSIRFIPGHGSDGFLGEEKVSNPYIRGLSKYTNIH